MEDIDLTEFKTVASAYGELAKRKDSVVSKVKQISGLKQQKKDLNKSFSDTIKGLDAEVEKEMEIMEQLKAHIKSLEKEIRITA